MTADDDTPAPDEPSAEARASRRPFAIVLVATLGVWKAYEAIAAATVHATIASSLYLPRPETRP